MDEPRGLDLTAFDRYLDERGITYDDAERAPLAFAQWMALETGRPIATRPAETDPDRLM